MKKDAISSRLQASSLTPQASSLKPQASVLLRRSFLFRGIGSLGSLALAHLLATERAAAGAPLAPKLPHHAPRAKALISLFQHGGPSQMDLFDPKPELSKRHGEAYPGD